MTTPTRSPAQALPAPQKAMPPALRAIAESIARSMRERPELYARLSTPTETGKPIDSKPDESEQVAK